MKESHDRLRELRIKKGFESTGDVARAYGWNEYTYKSHENGMRGIKPKVAEKYAQAFGSSVSYILTGVGEDIPATSSVDSVIVAGIVSAGIFIEAVGSGAEGGAVPAVPRADISADDQYALKISGESVNLKIADGAYAICAPLDKHSAEHGSLVHVVRERAGLYEHTIKQLRYTRNGTVLVPMSNSPNHQEPIPIDGHDGDEVRIQGVVIGSFQAL